MLTGHKGSGPISLTSTFAGTPERRPHTPMETSKLYAKEEEEGVSVPFSEVSKHGRSDPVTAPSPAKAEDPGQ